jgi:hypothetical protein
MNGHITTDRSLRERYKAESILNTAALKKLDQCIDPDSARNEPVKFDVISAACIKDRIKYHLDPFIIFMTTLPQGDCEALGRSTPTSFSFDCHFTIQVSVDLNTQFLLDLLFNCKTENPSLVSVFYAHIR